MPEKITPQEKSPQEKIEETIELFNNGETLNPVGSIRIAVINSTERKSDISIPPVFETATDGEYIAMPTENSNEYAIFPRHRDDLSAETPFGETLLVVGDMARVFGLPKTNQQPPNLVKPAIFRENNESWQMISPGKVSSANETPEPLTQSPAETTAEQPTMAKETLPQVPPESTAEWLEKFEEKSLKYMEKLLEQGADKNNAAASLAGLDSDKAWQMREKLLEQGANKGAIAQGLAGLDSDRAWQMREKLLEQGADKGAIAQGLTGLDSDRAWQMREKLLEQGADKNFVAGSLTGLDSDKAWQMREKLLEQGADKGAIAQGLAGLDSDKAWQMREKLIKQGVNNYHIAESLAGLDSDRAWQMREELIKQKVYDFFIAESLTGLDSDRAWQMREELIKQGVNNYHIAESLAGLDSDRAWAMRDKFLRQGAKQHLGECSVPISLAGLDSDKAWQMREKLLKQGADKNAIAQGLTGYFANFVWRIKLQTTEKGGKKSVIRKAIKEEPSSQPPAETTAEQPTMAKETLPQVPPESTPDSENVENEQKTEISPEVLQEFLEPHKQTLEKLKQKFTVIKDNSEELKKFIDEIGNDETGKAAMTGQFSKKFDGRTISDFPEDNPAYKLLNQYGDLEKEARKQLFSVLEKTKENRVSKVIKEFIDWLVENNLFEVFHIDYGSWNEIGNAYIRSKETSDNDGYTVDLVKNKLHGPKGVIDLITTGTFEYKILKENGIFDKYKEVMKKLDIYVDDSIGEEYYINKPGISVWGESPVKDAVISEIIAPGFKVLAGAKTADSHRTIIEPKSVCTVSKEEWKKNEKKYREKHNTTARIEEETSEPADQSTAESTPTEKSDTLDTLEKIRGGVREQMGTAITGKLVEIGIKLGELDKKSPNYKQELKKLYEEFQTLIKQAEEMGLDDLELDEDETT